MNINRTNSSNKGGVLLSGYDLPVYGLSNGSFYYIHIPALICIFSSLCCVLDVLILSFRQKDYKSFFRWTKSERLIVYLAICDGCFNLTHSMDHLHYTITRDHVRPRELCEFYGFIMGQFLTAQNLLVNIVAINAFVLMFLNKNLEFGKADWRLMAWTLGVPIVSYTAPLATGQLGPSGSFCLFDGVKGGTANICLITVPLLTIFIIKSILYILTWKRINQQTSRLKFTTANARRVQKSARAARNMSMFVLAFFIQWSSLAVFGAWALVDANVPQALHHIVTILSNIGGCLNLGVYMIIKRRSRSDGNCDGGNITRSENSQINNCGSSRVPSETDMCSL